MPESASRRETDGADTEILVVSADRRTLNAIVEATAQFVRDNSESGEVGRAFVAALFDLRFGSDLVRMANNNDPFAATPGDVRVGSDGSFWLWAEVKQGVVATSEIQAFVDRVKAVGGDRAMFFALGDSPHQQDIHLAQLREGAVGDGIELAVFCSPEQAMIDFLPKVAGNAGMQAERLANRMLGRLRDAQVTGDLETQWIDLIEEVASRSR